MDYEFKSERIGFRKWRESDKIVFASLNEDKDVMEFFPKTLSKIESDNFVLRINQKFKEYSYGLYAVDELATKNFMGFIGFGHPSFELGFSPFIEIGWRLGKQYWNKGYATEGALECIKYGFNKLKFQNIYAFTAKTNLKSERIMQKIGMGKYMEFEHPKIEFGSKLKTHVLYKIDNTALSKGHK